MRDHRSNGQSAWTPPRSSRPLPIAGVQGAAITQAGSGGRPQVRFEQPVATKESVEDLSSDVLAALAGIRRVDLTLDKNTSILDKKVAALETIVAKANKQAQQQAQMSLMLPLLLQQTPQLEKITFKEVPTATQKTVEIEDSVFKKTDILPLLLISMMGGWGGGLVGGEGESGGMNMLILALALGGGLGK